jgi:hypothetical protein
MDGQHALDGRITAGRKGIPYDWRAVLADARIDTVVHITDEALAGLVSAETVTR